MPPDHDHLTTRMRERVPVYRPSDIIGTGHMTPDLPEEHERRSKPLHNIASLPYTALVATLIMAALFILLRSTHSPASPSGISSHQPPKSTDSPLSDVPLGQNFVAFYPNSNVGARIIDNLTIPDPTGPPHRIGARKGRRPITAITSGGELRLGDCWSFPGNYGRLAVSLPTAIRISHVGISHIPISQAVDPGIAPRVMTLWGISDPSRGDGPISYGQHKWGHYFAIPLMQLEYTIHSTQHHQYFPFTSPGVSDLTFKQVALEVESNWGSTNNYTCLYRFMLYGAQN